MDSAMETPTQNLASIFIPHHINHSKEKKKYSFHIHSADSHATLQCFSIGFQIQQENGPFLIILMIDPVFSLCRIYIIFSWVV